MQVGVDTGLILRYVTISSDDEWDHYEELYGRAIERYTHLHPRDPNMPSLQARIRRWRDGYFRWERDTLGFALSLSNALRIIVWRSLALAAAHDVLAVPPVAQPGLRVVLP